MRLRPRQRALAGRGPGAPGAGQYRGPARPRPARIRRARRWLRIGALLAIIGVLRFGRGMRAHWEPVFLLGGVLLMAGGYFLPVIGFFFPGLLVITVTLLKGNSDRWRGARPGRPAGARAAEPPASAGYRVAVYSRAGYRPERCGGSHPPR